jgi:Tol biopolymer transport system component
VKRLVLVLVPLVLVFSGCAVPVVKPPTYLSDKGAVFNGDIYSNVNGDADYSWSISYDNGGGGTSTRTVRTVNGQRSAVSTPFTILDPATTYHLTLCAADHQENPPRQVCSKPTDFTTPPTGGRSGIALERGGGHIWVMNSSGAFAIDLTPGATASGFPSWSPDATKIAYAGPGGIWTMKMDGTNKVNLTPEAGFWGDPEWSPDGTKIAFAGGHSGADAGIWVMNADGTNKIKLADDTNDVAQVTWRPDGEKIAYTTDTGISVMNADGSNQHNISSLSGDYEVAWSPDATKILFKHGGLLWTMSPDGSNRTQLSTSISNIDDRGTWSPDGTKIAFVSYRADRPDIWRMDANGANPINLTNSTSWIGADTPAWSPRP